LHAAGLFQHGTKVLLKGEHGKLGDEISQRLFLVLADEELRVGKARVNHLQISVHHHVLKALVSVAHDDEVLGQVSVLVQHREIALVLAHHANQHFRGQAFQIALLKSPQHGSRAFHQVGHFLQQVGVIRQFSAGLRGQLARLLPYQRLPSFRVQYDALRVQIRQVILQAAQRAA